MNTSPEAYRHTLSDAIQVTDRPKCIVNVDLDGDGIDEEVKYDVSESGASFLSIARVGEDRHYSLYTRNFYESAGLAGMVDVTGDAVPEMVWWHQVGADSFDVHISQLIVDRAAVKDSILSSYGWSTGGRMMPDGSWGGSVLLWGGLDSDGDGTVDIVALGFNTGITREPRAVSFLDSRTSEMLSRVRTGGTPTGGSAIADVDGDGSDELVLGLEAPGNGNRAGDWDDGHSYVVAFETDGSILWWRELGVYSSNVDLAVNDLDGDGSPEVVTVVGGHSEQDVDTFRLSVWAGRDGTLLAERRSGFSINAVVTFPCREGIRIFTGSSDGFVRRLRWTGDALQMEAELDCEDAVEHVSAVRLEPEPAPPRLVVGIVRGCVAALDEDLAPLAVRDVGEPVRDLRPTMVTVDARAAHGLLVVGHSRILRLRLVERPLPVWVKSTLPAAVALIAFLLLPLTRRTGVGWLRRWLLPRKSRGDALDGLLYSLMAASHGKLAVTSMLRRLREQFRMLQYHQGAPPQTFRERFDQTVRDMWDVSLPGITTIVEEAERLGLVVRHTASLRKSVKLLEGTLRELPCGPLSTTGATALGVRLDGILPGVEESLVAVRAAAEHERSSDAGVELDRALSACSSELRRRDVVVQVDGRNSISGVRVMGTSGEVSFVLENLLANAIEAVRDRSVRRISVSSSADSGRVTIRVADTGKGMTLEEQARLFTPGSTAKTSGGRGLSLSRDMLSRRGGSIDLLKSSPGDGAVLEVRFAVCRS